MPNPTITKIIRGTSRTDFQLLKVFKGIVHLNMTIMLSFTHPNVLNLTFTSMENKRRTLFENIMNFQVTLFPLVSHTGLEQNEGK